MALFNEYLLPANTSHIQQFVAMAGITNSLISTDGVFWPRYNTGTSLVWQAIAYGNGIYTAVGTTAQVSTSNNGIAWNTQAFAGSITNTMNGVAYGNGIFVAGGGGGAIQTSPDGTTWTNRTSANIGNLNCVGYGGGLYVAGGSGFVLQTSTNAITWTNIIIGGTAIGINGIVYG